MARTRATSFLVLACLFVLGAAGSARAVDQLIAGDLHQVQTGTMAKMLAKSKDFALPAGDPRQDGGQLQITDTGGGSSLTIDLPASGWKRIGSPDDPKGYKYNGAGTADDPCKLVMVREREIKFMCIGAGITLDTPFAGTSAIILTVDGTRYCAEFGGRTQRNDEQQLRRRNAPAPTACGAGGGGTTSTSSTSSTTVATPTTSSTTVSTPTTSSTTVATPTTSSTTVATPTTSSTTVATPTTSSTTVATPTTSSTTVATPTTSSTTVATPTTSSTTAPTPTTSTSSTSSTL